MIYPKRQKHEHLISANSRVVRNINSAVILNSIPERKPISRATVVNGALTAGTHTATFDASRLASGVYIYKLVAGSFVSTKKMLFFKYTVSGDTN